MEFAELMALASGHAEARAIQAALRLGLFELIGDKTRDADRLAEQIGAAPDALAVLCNALTALGLLEKGVRGYSAAEPARTYLLESSEHYVGGMILFEEAIFPYWAKLEEAIRTGKPVRVPDMFQARPEDTRLFIHAMDSLVRARGDARWLAENLEMRGDETIADVGGGPGTYVIDLLRRWPRARAAILDLPATLAVTAEIVSQRAPELRERIELIPFDYHRDKFSTQYDAVLLSNIIHSEDPESNRRLIAKLLPGVRSGGRVIIKDHVMNAALTEPRAGAVFSLYLLLTTAGRDYSFEEMREWLAAAGFSEIRLHPLPSPPFTSSLVIGRKP